MTAFSVMVPDFPRTTKKLHASSWCIILILSGLAGTKWSGFWPSQSRWSPDLILKQWGSNPFFHPVTENHGWPWHGWGSAWRMPKSWLFWVGEASASEPSTLLMRAVGMHRWYWRNLVWSVQRPWKEDRLDTRPSIQGQKTESIETLSFPFQMDAFSPKLYLSDKIVNFKSKKHIWVWKHLLLSQCCILFVISWRSKAPPNRLHFKKHHSTTSRSLYILYSSNTTCLLSFLRVKAANRLGTFDICRQIVLLP